MILLMISLYLIFEIVFWLGRLLCSCVVFICVGGGNGVGGCIFYGKIYVVWFDFYSRKLKFWIWVLDYFRKMVNLVLFSKFVRRIKFLWLFCRCGRGSIVVFSWDVIRVFGDFGYGMWGYGLGFVICYWFRSKWYFIWYWNWDMCGGVMEFMNYFNYIVVFWNIVVLYWCLSKKIWF